MNIRSIKECYNPYTITETQTKKGRIERWQNMEGKFELMKPEKIQDKNILLVDDVVTTGATLEACGHELLKAVIQNSASLLFRYAISLILRVFFYYF